MINGKRLIKKILFGGGVFLAANYPILSARTSIQTKTYRIPVRGLPEEFSGFTIIHIADLHYGKYMPMEVIRDVIYRVNRMERDIIVNTGDNVYHHRDEQTVNEIWPLLLELHAPRGVYSVLGNHDHWASTKRSLEWLENSGQNLRHRSVAIEKNGSRIWLGGAGDLLEDENGVDRAFSGVPEDEFKILLAHNPDTADIRFKTKVNLVLSGHTHGGQVNIPLLGPPILPVYNRRYAAGYVRSAHTNVFISRGVGSTFPIRFNCPAEIAVLKLVPED